MSTETCSVQIFCPSLLLTCYIICCNTMSTSSFCLSTGIFWSQWAWCMSVPSLSLVRTFWRTLWKCAAASNTHCGVCFWETTSCSAPATSCQTTASRQSTSVFDQWTTTGVEDGHCCRSLLDRTGNPQSFELARQHTEPDWTNDTTKIIGLEESKRKKQQNNDKRLVGGMIVALLLLLLTLTLRDSLFVKVKLCVLTWTVCAAGAQRRWRATSTTPWTSSCSTLQKWTSCGWGCSTRATAETGRRGRRSGRSWGSWWAPTWSASVNWRGSMWTSTNRCVILHIYSQINVSTLLWLTNKEVKKVKSYSQTFEAKV